jgi:hypothetical protein
MLAAAIPWYSWNFWSSFKPHVHRFVGLGIKSKTSKKESNPVLFHVPDGIPWQVYLANSLPIQPTSLLFHPHCSHHFRFFFHSSYFLLNKFPFISLSCFIPHSCFGVTPRPYLPAAIVTMMSPWHSLGWACSTVLPVAYFFQFSRSLNLVLFLHYFSLKFLTVLIDLLGNAIRADLADPACFPDHHGYFL